MEVLPLEGSVQRNACIFVNVLSIEYEWKQLFEPLDVRDNINTSKFSVYLDVTRTVLHDKQMWLQGMWRI